VAFAGGTADKFGNRYEALWAIDQLIHIVDRTASNLILEPINQDESRGIEFTVATNDGKREFWSVKRQTTKAAGWTVALLARPDENGRSILGDLEAHVQRSAGNHAVFASTLGAYQLEELSAHAECDDVFEARLEQSKDLRAAFAQILSLCCGDRTRARTFLLRTRSHAADEAQLRQRLGFSLRKLFYPESGLPLDEVAVRAYLSDLLLESIHTSISRELILRTLATRGIRQREWAIEKNVTDRISAICDEYAAPLISTRINATFLRITKADSILSDSGVPLNKNVLVVSVAGGGKSTVLAETLERLREAHIPVIPIRFDQVSENISSTKELGQKLLLPESPVLVLAGIANGAPSVLLIDQLDAVSIASGRRVELWSLFDHLRREAAQFREMSLIVGCREFDLEHDHRMRAMRAEPSSFLLVTLNPISEDQLDEVLRSSQISPEAVQRTLKPILTTPLHLSMFLRLAPADRLSVRNREELFDSFWIEGERRADQRLGRKAAWAQVIDKLANWLSANQQLSAPKHIMDDYAADAQAMASDCVLIFEEGRYRFFHESFFDYSFARRFASKGERLVNLLLASEQHLFRRAQVRQVLSYLRAKDKSRYLQELAELLMNPDVRFHLKRAIFQWLSSLSDPQSSEWEILQHVCDVHPDLKSHVLAVVAGNSSWFDVLLGTGFFDAALSSADNGRADEAIWMFGFAPIMERRSEQVAALLRKYRKPTEAWNEYLRYVCRLGPVFHSRDMLDLFLSLIDDGTLDGIRPGFAVNDNWWTVLYSMADKRPDLACEAIGHWLDRTVILWRSGSVGSPDNADASFSLLKQINQSSHGTHIIVMAAKSPSHYAGEILPRIAQVVSETAKECAGHLMNDPMWSFRSFKDHPLQIHSALFSSLATSLETLAATMPADLDRLLSPYQDRPHDAVAYLVLRAWTAAPELYGDRLAQYLAADDRRLKIGYAMWGDAGSAENYVSLEAVKAASARCSAERFSALEQVILSIQDDWEAKKPQFRGRRQLELLNALSNSRLGVVASSRLAELKRKFPGEKNESPSPWEVLTVESPIPQQAQAKMSDAQWLRAMRKYAGVGDWSSRKGKLSGGEHELALAIQSNAQTNPGRFAALALKMSDDMPGSFFDAIIRGIAGNTKGTAEPGGLNLGEAARMIIRVHGLTGRPCGRSITSMIEKWGNRDWPDDVLDAVAWYAVNDPDPATEAWKIVARSGQAYYGGDPYTAGINSARGNAAGAIMQLLLHSPQTFPRLEKAVHCLTHDNSVAVRSCAVGTLLAVLSIDSQKATAWFKNCLNTDPDILDTPYVEKFVRYAAYKDPLSIRPVVKAMLDSGLPGAVEAAARQICIVSLSSDAFLEDAELVHRGTATMRRAAAYVYSANVSHGEVGATCRIRIRPFFADEDDSVRTEAASAFQHIATLSTSDQGSLLAAFLDAAPTGLSLVPVVHALEDSPVQLPDLVCRFAARCIEAYRTEAGDIRNAAAAISLDLSKIVVRLYSQTEKPSIQTQCLNLIDSMERYRFLGLEEELVNIER
jgi:hypothetical protein